MANLQIQQETHLLQNTLDMAKEFQVNLNKGLGPVTTRGTLTSTLVHPKHTLMKCKPEKLQMQKVSTVSRKPVRKFSENNFAESIFFHKSTVRGQYTGKFHIST